MLKDLRSMERIIPTLTQESPTSQQNKKKNILKITIRMTTKLNKCFLMISSDFFLLSIFLFLNDIFIFKR